MLSRVTTLSGSFTTHRPFLRSDAIAAGIDPRVLRGARFRRLFRGVLVDASVPLTPRLRVEAALLPFGDSAFASHASAARLLGIPIPNLPEEWVTVTDPNDRRAREGIRCVQRSPTTDLLAIGGIRISGYCRVFLELSDLLTLVDLVIVGDHLVQKGKVTPADLIEAAQTSRLPGPSLARQAARFVRAGVDSPMETRLRMLLVLAGLPEPEVNHLIRDETGHIVRRYDLWYAASETLVEYEGRQHADNEAQWHSDITRREELDERNRRLLTVTSRGIYADPAGTLTRIRRVLAARGEPGVPRTLSDAWRAHFPGYG